MTREMKNSGVEWIGDIPSEWKIIKNKYLLNSLYSGGTPSSANEDFYSENGVAFVSISDMSKTKYIYETKKKLTTLGLQDKNLKVLPIGTILYSIYATIGEIAELKVEATISQALLALNINENIDKQYYKYNLMAMKDYVFSNANGNTQFNLNAEKVWNFILVLPPLHEQKKIADFLDSKVTEIDKIISETKASIENYKEYKQSVITEAVTKGLDKNVPMKESGIEWIGKIPCEWNIQPLKYIIKIRNEKTNDTQNYIGMENVESKTGKIINQGSIQAEKEALSIKKGDVLFGKLRPYLAKVYRVEIDGCCSTEFMVSIPERIDGQFLKYLYLANGFIQTINMTTYGTKMPRANAEFIKNLKIVLPTSDEQRKIAIYLDRKCTKIDNLVEEKEKLIENIEEYKKSLIYEYVTGKKAVE